MERFCEGLKLHIQLEVCEEKTRKLEAATKIVLNVDIAPKGAGLLTGRSSDPNMGNSSGPTLREMGNLELN